MAHQKTVKRNSRRLVPLDRRFNFLGDAVTATDRKALRSAQYEVLDTLSGQERSLTGC